MHQAGDAEIEIRPEFAKLHQFFKIAVGGADQPEFGPLPGVAANQLVGVLLNCAQKLGLQCQRQFADLVKEECAVIGQGESAVALRDGTSESTRSWPKNSLPESSGMIVVQSSTTRSVFVGRGSN